MLLNINENNNFLFTNVNTPRKAQVDSRNNEFEGTIGIDKTKINIIEDDGDKMISYRGGGGSSHKLYKL